MRAINHALTGATIGLVISEPVVAIPAALASHLVLDVIPHHGNTKTELTSASFKLGLVADGLACGLLALLIFSSGSSHWLIASICAFAAAAPDLLSIRRFAAAFHDKPFHYNKLEKFLKNIQWFERPIGAVVEVAWFVAGVIFVAALV